MAAITIEPGYSDIYSDLYGGSAGDVYILCQIAFETNPGDDPVWEDVSQYVRSFRTRRGRTREFEHFSPGTLTVELDNRDRRFDPSYEDSPYYPNVLPQRRIRFSASYEGITYPLFDGFVDSWPQSYIFPNEAAVSLDATDGFKMLAAQHVPSVWEQEVRADSPVSWWRFSDKSGTVAADSIGETPGTYVEEPDLSAGSLLTKDSDSAVRFDGESQWMDIPSLTLTTPFSIECWFEADEDQPALTPHIWGFQGFYNTYAELYLEGTKLRSTVNNFLVPNASIVDSLVDVVDGKRHHVVVQYGPAGHKVYVDGFDQSDVITGPVLTHGLGQGWMMWGSSPGGIDVGFAGSIDEAVVYSSALSASRVAAHWLAGTEPWAGDLSGARIQKTLTAAGWTGGTDLDAGSSTLTAADLDGSALDHIQAVAQTEDGRLFMGPDGDVVLIGRRALITEAVYSTSQATFGDADGEMKYADITPDEDDLIYNEVTVTSRTFPEQKVEDTDSQTAYLRRSYDRESLDSTPAAMRSTAQAILGKYKEPQLRIGSLTIKPRRDPALWPYALGLELGERITANRRPQGIGDPISQEVHIESIEHSGDAKAQTWVTKWTLSSADTKTYWQLGVSRLGTDTRLAH